MCALPELLGQAVPKNLGETWLPVYSVDLLSQGWIEQCKSLPVELDIEIGMSQSGTLDKYTPNNGILHSLFVGLEDEIERASRKMYV